MLLECITTVPCSMRNHSSCTLKDNTLLSFSTHTGEGLQPPLAQQIVPSFSQLCCGRPSRIDSQDDPHHRRRTAPARCIHHADNEAETCTTYRYSEHHILVSTSEQQNAHTGPLFPQSFSTNDMALCATPPEHETAQSTRIPQVSVRNNIEAMSPNAGPLPSPACADDANNKWDNISAADAPHPS